MNRLKVDLTFTADTVDRLTWYSVSDADNNILFRGKAYILANASTVTLDLTDIVSGFIYKGFGLMNPTWDNVSGGYQQPYSGSNWVNTSNPWVTVIDGRDGEYHIDSLTVKLYSDSTFTTQISTATANNVYFHSIAPQDYKGSLANYDSVLYYFDPVLVPHLPKIRTKNLTYGQLMRNDYSGTRQFVWSNFGGTGVQNQQTMASKKNYTYACSLYTILGSTFTDNKMYHRASNSNRFPILAFDECPRPYYLIWLNPNGGCQSLGFEGKSIYTENHNVNYKLSYDDYSYKANQTLSSQWQLKSELVSDAQYQCIATAARSPYCILYITELDRSFYVNVIDTSQEIKTYRNQGNKPFIAELKVEGAERDFIII